MKLTTIRNLAAAGALLFGAVAATIDPTVITAGLCGSCIAVVIVVQLGLHDLRNS